MPVGQFVHPPLRQTHQTTPSSSPSPSPRLRSPPARSPDRVPLPASGPFDPGLIPSEGPPRPRSHPPQPVAWAAQGRSPLPPPVTLQGIPERSAHFFALLLPFRLRPPGFSLIVPKSPLPLPQDNQLLRAPVPLRGALVRQLVVRVLLRAVAAHVVPPLRAATLDRALNRHCVHALLAGCPHAKLTKKNPFAQETGCACGSPPLTRRMRRTQPGSPQKPQQGGWGVSECRWNAM